MSGLLFVPLLLFVVVVAPLWLLLHYITQWRRTKTLSAEDERMLVELWQSAQRMEDRIETLERILDADQPGWRGRQT
ncbi:MAG: envelope stress response membrane protein PspB [Alphaproteobacteria bacterium]|jgi:phage shock protein B|nr:envelope stress response membrane protein PspB [Alphaproteobacteria bacterium]